MNVGSEALVTGATGFIGRRLLGGRDRALVRQPGLLQQGVVGDLLNPGSLPAACEGIDRIFHCAGYAHAFASADADAHWRINFEGTRNLLEAAGQSGVRRFVFLSSVKAMAEPGSECIDESWPGRPESPYGLAKRAAEEAVLDAGAKYGMHVVNLRLAMVYGGGGRGNLERMARGIRAGWFPPLPETGNQRSMVHVDDVVAAMRFVADAPAANGHTYIVAYARAYSGREIYDTIRHALGMAPAWLRTPVWALRAAGMAGDCGERLLRRPLAMNSEVVSRLLDSACYSPARIEQELGWRARTGLADGVREMVQQRASGATSV